MPKNQIDYSKCVIYRIVCNDINIKECYVGHTTNLAKRSYGHKIDYRHQRDRKVYRFIREHGGFENWSVIQIEEYPCDTYDDALMRERYWIEYYKATLNSAQIRERQKCCLCNKFREKNSNCPLCKMNNFPGLILRSYTGVSSLPLFPSR